MIVKQYEEIIDGRAFCIEVRPVGAGDTRWRAQLRRRPNIMPFYGQTPDEAARLLSRWLSLVYGGPDKS